MKKVLVLENGTTIGNMLSNLIIKEECKILLPEKESKYKGEIPDLIIADLTSIKKEKVELLMHLKSSHITSLVPFLLVVSENGTGTKEELSVQNYYLNKPFTNDSLQNLVKKILSHTDSLNPW